MPAPLNTTSKDIAQLICPAIRPYVFRKLHNIWQVQEVAITMRKQYQIWPSWMTLDFAGLRPTGKHQCIAELSTTWASCVLVASL